MVGTRVLERRVTVDEWVTTDVILVGIRKVRIPAGAGTHNRAKTNVWRTAIGRRRHPDYYRIVNNASLGPRTLSDALSRCEITLATLSPESKMPILHSSRNSRHMICLFRATGVPAHYTGRAKI